ncbi:MAG: hypothetical protein EHM45_15750 [Desulfobacteraceae bacterium]|nr:MAG: hypothetical protein EHM45_15750 [Desulfobacteraceae bacterium]
MNHLTIFPDPPLSTRGVVSNRFLKLGVKSFQEACRYVSELPYGYNSDCDDLLILFKDNMGTCATKHAVIATLAHEQKLLINKTFGIYAMTEEIVSGTNRILKNYALPYLPMPHCFLSFAGYRVDLSAGNRNGKNKPIEEFLFSAVVAPAITAQTEYLLYKEALLKSILIRPEMQSISLTTVLNARAQGLELLKSKISFDSQTYDDKGLPIPFPNHNLDGIKPSPVKINRESISDAGLRV